MVDIQFNNDELVILKNSQRKVIPLKELSPKLLNASNNERNLYRISTSGYGIHWPLNDEDISIKALFND
ncbi:DUF2442 domain-containing protein [Algoriphagus sp.]|uniref:DUF2442 domain-containing protein n=1 Tax=Algoriphagus sp. TaxID=1872435 RepID=UPI0039188686